MLENRLPKTQLGVWKRRRIVVFDCGFERISYELSADELHTGFGPAPANFKSGFCSASQGLLHQMLSNQAPAESPAFQQVLKAA